MPFSVSDILALGTAIIGVIGNIIYVAYITGKFRAEVETELKNIKEDIEKDQRIREDFIEKIDRIDLRARIMETSMATMTVKMDNLKEGQDDLKKAVLEHLNRLHE